ncbi:MAG TPA: ATP-binding protein [bacterium]|nr:ATP-binding protein [bacterium]
MTFTARWARLAAARRHLLFRLCSWTAGVVCCLFLLLTLFLYEQLDRVLRATQDDLLVSRAVVIASGFDARRGGNPPFPGQRDSGHPPVSGGDDRTPAAADSGRHFTGFPDSADRGREQPHWQDQHPGDSADLNRRWRNDRARPENGSGRGWRDSRSRDDNESNRWRERRRPDEPLTRILERGRQHHGDYCIIITDSRNAVVECSRGMAYRVDAFPRPDRAPQYFTASDTAGDRTRFLAYPMQTSEGQYRLYVGQSLDRVTEPLHRMLLMLAVALPAGMLLLCAGLFVITARGLRPLRTLARGAARMDGRDPAARLPVPDIRDEVAELAISFNGLLERIGSATARVRQFTADAAHELRTPLAGLKGRLQVARRRDRSVTEYRELLAALEGDTRQLEALLDGLLLLARLDRSRELPVAACALQPLVAQVAAEPQFAGMTITNAVPAGLAVTANDTLLIQLFRNLFDNARKYAGAAAVIVDAASGADGTVITVADDGPGAPPEALPRLFDSFYKADAAHTVRGSAGLGLSIVAAIAAAHGGSAAAANRSPRGLQITITLPAGPSSPQR